MLVFLASITASGSVWEVPAGSNGIVWEESARVGAREWVKYIVLLLGTKPCRMN